MFRLTRCPPNDHGQASWGFFLNLSLLTLLFLITTVPSQLFPSHVRQEHHPHPRHPRGNRQRLLPQRMLRTRVVRRQRQVYLLHPVSVNSFFFLVACRLELFSCLLCPLGPRSALVPLQRLSLPCVVSPPHRTTSSASTSSPLAVFLAFSFLLTPIQQ